MMKRFLVFALIVGLSGVVRANDDSIAKQAKHRVLYAPRPEYPLAARKQHWTGAGVFACNIRSDGTVASVDVLRSTGHQMLDQAAITGDMKVVKIPIDFWMNGSGVRHRMSGAVISD
jgi:TonB family protein